MAILQFSLRLKLTLWFLAIFTVVFLGVVLGAWLLHRQSMVSSLDQTLEGMATGIRDRIQNDATVGILHTGLERYQPANRQFSILALRDADGAIVDSLWNVDKDALPPVPPGDAAEAAIWHSIEGEQAERLIGRTMRTRMITYRLITSRGDVRYIDLIRTRDLLEEERSFFHDVFLVGALGALLASGIAAWLVAGRAVAPMKQIAESAQQVDPEHMGHRINVGSAEKEVTRLQIELNAALGRLEKGYRAQERFVNHVAHDLKTPIAILLAQTQTLEFHDLTGGAFDQYQSSTVAELQRLAGLLESFLTLARADHGATLARLTELSLNDIVVDAVRECEPEASQREVRLIAQLSDADADLLLRGDIDLLRAMVTNLIRNAIKFSPPGEAIEVSAIRKAGTGEVRVQDNGPGVPEEWRARVFEEFVRAPGQPAGDGLGLGLRIVQSVVSMHGGEVSVINGSAAGCTFLVRLPLLAPD